MLSPFAMPRVALTLMILALLAVTSPRPASASPLNAEFLNSNLTFGGAGFFHEGYDVDHLLIYDVDYVLDFPDTTFTASGGVLVQATPIFDGGGTLVRTEYLYQGGTFTVDFGVPALGGVFTAPIVSLLVLAGEPLSPYGSGGLGSGVLADYTLAEGAFDDVMANLLGIPKPTGPSLLADSSMLLLFGDHSSSELVADDGLTSVLIVEAPVPEPSLGLLVALGIGAAMRARRRS